MTTHTTNESTRPDPEQLGDRLAHDSPEGRPAHPELGALKISLILAAIVVLMLSVALVLALYSRSTIAIYIGIAAVVMFFVNPMFWVAIMRGRERQQMSERMSHEH